MKENSLRVDFVNKTNPHSGFDLIKLSDFIDNMDLNHDPYEIHLVEFYVVIFIHKGSGYHTIDFTDYPLKSGSIITVRKGQLHKFHKCKYDGYMLLFTDDFMVQYLEKLEALRTLQLFNELLGDPKLSLKKAASESIYHIIQRIKEEYTSINDDFSLKIIRSELHILITSLFRIKAATVEISAKRKYLNEFVQFQELVEDNVHDSMKVKEYAFRLGISTKTLNTISKTIINKTAKEFIDEIGIKNIKRLLINTDKSIKEIAFDSGFEETSNFYKFFKKHTLLTPEQFRATQ